VGTENSVPIENAGFGSVRKIDSLSRVTWLLILLWSHRKPLDSLFLELDTLEPAVGIETAMRLLSTWIVALVDLDLVDTVGCGTSNVDSRPPSFSQRCLQSFWLRSATVPPFRLRSFCPDDPGCAPSGQRLRIHS
jgi:hypothetical protein